MQTEGTTYTGFGDALCGIYEKDGLKDGLYAGVSAAYLRQWLYGSCRIGLYAYLLEQAQNKNIAAGLDKNSISLSSKMLFGLTSGTYNVVHILCFYYVPEYLSAFVSLL